MPTHKAALAAPCNTPAARRVAPALSSAERRDRDADRRRLAAERAAAVVKADGLLRLPEVLALVPLSPSTWWQGIRDGRFPAGLKLSARCTAWRAVDIRDLLERLSAEVAR